jgi:uncharacterized protein (DUF983 family)
MRWVPPPSMPAPPYAPPPFRQAALRGARNRCPVCGEGRVFAGYLRLVEACEVCGAPLGRLRADDAPPYFTILITGHLLVPLALMVEKAWMPPIWVHMAIWLPLFTIVCILVLRPIKGAVVGWMASLGFTVEEHGGAEAASLPARSGATAAPAAPQTRPR